MEQLTLNQFSISVIISLKLWLFKAAIGFESCQAFLPLRNTLGNKKKEFTYFIYVSITSKFLLSTSAKPGLNILCATLGHVLITLCEWISVSSGSLRGSTSPQIPAVLLELQTEDRDGGRTTRSPVFGNLKTVINHSLHIDYVTLQITQQEKVK